MTSVVMEVLNGDTYILDENQPDMETALVQETSGILI